MIDHLFSAALTFCLLAAGTAAIGSLMVEAPAQQRHAQVRIVELPRVVVIGHRQAASATVARTESTEPAPQRVQ